MIIYVNDYDVGIEALPTPTITLLLYEMPVSRLRKQNFCLNRWNDIVGTHKLSRNPRLLPIELVLGLVLVLSHKILLLLLLVLGLVPSSDLVL